MYCLLDNIWNNNKLLMFAAYGINELGRNK